MQKTIKFVDQIVFELKRIEDCPRQENENAPEATIVQQNIKPSPKYSELGTIYFTNDQATLVIPTTEGSGRISLMFVICNSCTEEI